MRRGPWLAPALSSVLAAAALWTALRNTDPTADPAAERGDTPERAAEEFARAYQRRDYEAATRRAAGALRRSLELRARSARLQGSVRAAAARELEIDESFLLGERRLKFSGRLVAPEALERAGAGDASGGWPVSLTVSRHGERYLVEAVSWPNGAPPGGR